jgi:hypothetical protein
MKNVSHVSVSIRFFSPGRALEPLSFMEVLILLNPFSSYVLHHSTTEPPSAAARYTVSRRCHRLPIVSGACTHSFAC